MAYYFRAFCTSETAPTLSEVLAWVRDRGVTLEPDGDTGRWGQAAVPLRYSDGKQPMLTELNRNTGPESLAAQEIDEFLELLRDVKKTPRKRNEVIKHLEGTRFIVACEIPVDDFDDAGFHALDVFLAYFLVHNHALIQADGQGFYEMGRLVVELAA